MRARGTSCGQMFLPNIPTQAAGHMPPQEPGAGGWARKPAGICAVGVILCSPVRHLLSVHTGPSQCVMLPLRPLPL